jgi:hypothetical protein
MGYYAKIYTGETTEISGVTIQHNEVVDVIVVDSCNDFLVTGGTLSGTWIKTCPQCWIRKNYAGKGMIYDDENDMFMKKQPFPSWSANTETGVWDPPVAYPDDGLEYSWDEDDQEWVEDPPFVSPSPTPTISVTPSISQTPTPSVTPSLSVGASPSPTPTISITPSWSPMY